MHSTWRKINPHAWPENLSNLGLVSVLAVATLSYARNAMPSQKPNVPVAGQASGSPVASDSIPQHNGATDEELTKRIRQALTDDSSLSTHAHNLTVTTCRGVVTLKGAVASREEESFVEGKAMAIAGATKVNNELKIKSKL
jgi:osmotically-inducible protein OsmY